MDSETSNLSNDNNKKNKCKNEKTKKMEVKEIDNNLNAVCIQMNKLAELEDNCTESGASSDSEDLINAINYNTITSLAALKDIIQGENTDTPETDSFFQHYFMNHCNNLSSRSSSTNSPFPFAERRRLSQCREEDEEDYKKEDLHPYAVGSKSSALEVASHGNVDNGNNRCSNDKASTNQDIELLDAKSPKRTVMGAKHKFLVTTAEPPAPMPVPTPITKEPIEIALRSQIHNAHTVHFGTKGAEEQRPNVRSIFLGENLHRDKNYFDSSLIEIRSPVNGLLTNSEDIWVKRTNDKPVLSKKEQFNNHKSSDILENKKSLPESDKRTDGERARSGTWGSQTARKEKEGTKIQPRGEKESTKNVDSKRNKREQRLDVAITRSTQSVGERKRRASDEAQPHTLYQQTIHGTSGVSRRPAIFNMFKGKNKGEPKKQSSLMKHVISAMQHLTKPSKSEGDTEVKDDIQSTSTSDPSTPVSPVNKDGSAHPHSGSDTRYYHTIAESSSRRPTGAIAKMRDVFRTSFAVQSTPVENAVRRKTKTSAQKQHYTPGANVRRAATQRRSSIGHVPLHKHRASDSFLDPHHAAILFRDSRGLPVADPFLEKVSRSDLEEDESQIFVKFFKFHKCYDLIPTSAKLVVFDTQLLVKKAFFALVYNGVRAAPLWDSQQQKFVGMLTITDFIKILQMYYTSPNVAMDELEEHRLETWRHVLKGSVQPLVSIGPDSSLYEAIRILILNRIHRLPVINPETGDVLYILTHKRILRFLFLYINELPKPAYLNCKLRELRIGTLSDIEMATEGTTIIEALKKFVNRRVSALPIVDAQGRLKDIYAKFDVINLAAEKTYNDLDVTLKAANEYRNEWFEGVQKCKLDETLYEVMERIVRAEVHRLVVVDEDEKVIGIISLSDLLMYLVLRATGECEGASLRDEHSIPESDEAAEPAEENEPTEPAEAAEPDEPAEPAEPAEQPEEAAHAL